MVAVETKVAGIKVKVEKVGEIKVEAVESRYNKSETVTGKVKIANNEYELGYHRYDHTAYAKGLDTTLIKNLGIELDYSEIEKEVKQKIEFIDNQRDAIRKAERTKAYEDAVNRLVILKSHGLNVELQNDKNEFIKGHSDAIYVYKMEHMKQTKNAKIYMGRQNSHSELKWCLEFDYKCNYYGKLANLASKLFDKKIAWKRSVDCELQTKSQVANEANVALTEINGAVVKSDYDKSFRIPIKKNADDYSSADNLIFKTGTDYKTKKVTYHITNLPELTADQVNAFAALLKK
jgi:hypothetical protein